MSVISGILASDATNSATDAASDAQSSATAEQRREFNLTQQNFQPYKEIGDTAAARFQAFTTGQDTTYNDPSYKLLSGKDLAQARWDRIQKGEETAGSDFWKDVNNGEDPISRLAREGNSVQLYRAPDGNYTNQAAQITQKGGYDPSTDPLYKNQMTTATREATQRAAGSGQSSQGGALQTRLAQLGNQVYNNTYQTKYQELTDALKVGQGAAGSISSAGAALGSQIQAGATNTGNIAMNNANTQSSLYGGMSGQAASILSKVGSQNGWWGGGSTGSSSGSWWGGSAAEGGSIGSDAATYAEMA